MATKPKSPTKMQTGQMASNHENARKAIKLMLEANSVPEQGRKGIFDNSYNRPRTSAKGMKGKTGSQSGKTAKKKGK